MSLTLIRNKLKKREISNDYTLKLYPYIQELLNNLTKSLNKTLVFELGLDPEYIDKCLLADYRDKFGGFNHSLAIEFLIFFYNSFDNNVDKNAIIKPEMRKFIEKKDKIEIVEDDDNND